MVIIFINSGILTNSSNLRNKIAVKWDYEILISEDKKITVAILGTFGPATSARNYCNMIVTCHNFLPTFLYVKNKLIHPVVNPGPATGLWSPILGILLLKYFGCRKYETSRLLSELGVPFSIGRKQVGIKRWKLELPDELFFLLIIVLKGRMAGVSPPQPPDKTELINVPVLLFKVSIVVT